MEEPILNAHNKLEDEPAHSCDFDTHQRHNAIKNVMEVPHYEIEKGIVFCNDNLHVEGPLTYLPIYMLQFLKNEVKLDLKPL